MLDVSPPEGEPYGRPANVYTRAWPTNCIRNSPNSNNTCRESIEEYNPEDLLASLPGRTARPNVCLHAPVWPLRWVAPLPTRSESKCSNRRCCPLRHDDDVAREYWRPLLAPDRQYYWNLLAAPGPAIQKAVDPLWPPIWCQIAKRDVAVMLVVVGVRWIRKRIAVGHWHCRRNYRPNWPVLRRHFEPLTVTS